MQSNLKLDYYFLNRMDFCEVKIVLNVFFKQILWSRISVLTTHSKKNFFLPETGLNRLFPITKHLDLRVSVWLLLNTNEQFFSYIMARTSYTWIRWWCQIVFNQQTELDFYSDSSLKNSSLVDMSLHLDTLFWFKATPSLLLCHNAACLVEKQQIPIL